MKYRCPGDSKRERVSRCAINESAEKNLRERRRTHEELSEHGAGALLDDIADRSERGRHGSVGRSTLGSLRQRECVAGDRTERSDTLGAMLCVERRESEWRCRRCRDVEAVAFQGSPSANA